MDPCKRNGEQHQWRQNLYVSSAAEMGVVLNAEGNGVSQARTLRPACTAT